MLGGSTRTRFEKYIYKPDRSHIQGNALPLYMQVCINNTYTHLREYRTQLYSYIRRCAYMQRASMCFGDMQARRLALLGGSWDLLTTDRWGYNPHYNSENLRKSIWVIIRKVIRPSISASNC